MNTETQPSAGLGAAVIVRGQVVAWFADFTEEAREWCTENHFGEWLTWRAKPPEIVPLTEAEYDEAMRKGAELAARLNVETEATNAELRGALLFAQVRASAGLCRRQQRRTEMNEQKIEQALEMARCADYNMDNLASWQPSVTSNPMFIMVRAQLRSAIDLLEGGEGELMLEA